MRMRGLAGQVLAAGYTGCIFFAALLIALSGERSIGSDWLVGLAFSFIVPLLVFRWLNPVPKVDSVILSQDDKNAWFTTWAAFVLGGLSLLLIYRGAFPQHQQLLAGVSCAMSLLGTVMLAANVIHQRRKDGR